MKIETALKICIAICFSLLLLAYVYDDGNQPISNQQLQAEVQQLQADNKKLTERVDANDAIVNRWLMEEGERPE